MSTQHLKTKEKEIDNVLAEYLPKLTDKQQEALKQISTSDKLPKTKIAWCKFLGISRNAYYSWLCQRDWQDAFLTIVRLTNSLHIPNIIDNIKARTKRSDVASRLFMEYIGVLSNDQNKPIITNTTNIALLATHRDDLKTIADQYCQGLLSKPIDNEVIEGEINGE